jgi:hypothetical protein
MITTVSFPSWSVRLAANAGSRHELETLLSAKPAVFAGRGATLYDYSLPGMRLFTWIPQIERLGPSYVRGRRRSGICFGAFCFGCGYLTAFIVTRNQWRDEMIKRGVARYNWQTGKWEWGEPPSRPD